MKPDFANFVRDALAAGYPPEEINLVLARNGFFASSPPSPTPKSVLAGVGEFLAQPFLQAGKTIGAGAFEAKRLVESVLPPNRNTQRQLEIWGRKNPFMTEAELAAPNFVWEKGVKPAAGVVAMGVPGAGLRQGLAAGALAGFSAAPGSTPQEVLAETLGGGAIGGVAGKAAQVLGKVLSPQVGKKLQEAGAELKQGIRQVYLPSSVFGAEKEEIINRFLDARGFRGTAAQQYKKIPQVFRELNDEIEKFVAANQVLADPGPLRQKLVERMFAEGSPTPVIGALKFADLNRAAKVEFEKVLRVIFGRNPTDPIPLQKLFLAKNQLNSKIGTILKKQDLGTPLSQAEEVILAARNTLDDLIAEIAPALKEKTIAQSYLHDAAEALGRARKNVPTLRGLATSIPTSVANRVQDALGTTLQRTGQKLSGLPPVPPVLGQALPAVTVRAVSSTPPPTEQKAENTGILPTEEATTVNLGGREVTRDEILAGINRAILAGDTKAASQLRGLLEANFSAGKPTEKQRQFQVAAEAARHALDLLEQNRATTGPLAGRAEKLRSRLVGTTADQQDFMSTLALARSAAVSAFFGANITKQEYERILDLIPEITDPLPTAKQKLRSFVRELARFSALPVTPPTLNVVQ